MKQETGTSKAIGTHFYFLFMGEQFTGLRKFSDRRIGDAIARRLSYHFNADIEVGYIGRDEEFEHYEARWFDGSYHREEVSVITHPGPLDE